MSVPNPTVLARIAERKLAAAAVPTEKAKHVRPGLVEQTVTEIHQGVVKSKHLEPGMEVQPMVHGTPRGSKRVVKKISRVGNGAMWLVEWATPHPDAEFKAAYRWYCEALDGATVTRTVKVPGLVPYQEV